MLKNYAKHRKYLPAKKIYELVDLNFLNKNYYNVGLLGGSFNPAHIGHIHISEQALKKLQLDYVIWLVALQNNLKPKYQLDIFSRAQNALALTANSSILISTLEHDLKQSITYEVIKSLYVNFALTKFTWVMGSDNLKNFHLWENFASIPKFCDIAIFNRPGSIIDEQDLQHFKAKFTSSIDKKQSNSIILHQGPMIDISSTQLIMQK